MLKRILVAGAALALTSGVAFAGVPYIGASVGEITNTTDTSNKNFRGLPLMLHAGYGSLLSPNLYLAAELFGTLGSATLNDNGLKTTYGYGASLIPGVLLGDHTMTYVRAGVVRSRFTASGTPNRDVNGGQLGLGMQIGMTQSLDLRGEYTYTAYQTFSGISAPRQDQFTLGLIYKFD
ncbi:MAG TPA: outer membrane beta-barrel protein [Gammaproteobacteria bacterium]|nr:outer membrane beta-barrel protein [Gammaproteobacteria bacterium]